MIEIDDEIRCLEYYRESLNVCRTWIYRHLRSMGLGVEL